MPEPIMLKIDSKADRDTVAQILYRNGYRVEPATVKVKKSYQYYVRAEYIKETVIQSSEDAVNEC